MYGKEIEEKINIQSGGTFSSPSSIVNPINKKQLKNEIKEIVKPDLLDRNYPNFKKGFINFTNAYRKYIRITIMILFFLFFYKILLNILNFFDVDEIHSNTYMLWLSIVIILYTLLPIKKSYLTSKLQNGSDDSKNTNNFSSIYLLLTIFFIILSILSGIFYRH